MQKVDILNYLKTQYSTLKDKYEIKSIGLFGSYAKDTNSDKSDIDIFVDMKPKFLNLMALKELIEKDLNKKVDIVRLRKNMNPYLKKRILEDGIYAV
jgi:predicted nucleotidyltransferase